MAERASTSGLLKLLNKDGDCATFGNEALPTMIVQLDLNEWYGLNQPTEILVQIAVTEGPDG